MKYFLFIVVIVFIVFLGCGYSEIRNQNLNRPVFDVQKTIYLNRSMFEFIPTYYVYNAKYATYYDKLDQKEGTLFKITKKADFSSNYFLVNDLKNKKNMILKENKSKTPGNEIINYSIIENGNIIMTITQTSRLDIFKYDIIYNNEKYFLEGKMNRTLDIIHSFVFTLTNENKTHVNIFKEYNYFKNETEIIINRKEKTFSDMMFISISVFINQILRENGYENRS